MAWTLLLFPLLAAGEEQGAAAADVIQKFGLEEAATPVRERDGWRKPERILVVSSIPKLAEQLATVADGAELIVATPTDAAAKARDEDVDVVIGLCSAEVIEAAPSLRWIQVFSSGVERCVSIPAIRERGILLTNMQRIAGPVIAEHVMAMMLALTRNLDSYIQTQQWGRWNRDPTTTAGMTVVQGKTMLVVGLGGIGTEVARRAHALGMRVVATRASGRSGPEFVSHVGLPEEMIELAREADFVVNTAPLTPQTTGIFNAEFFRAMKPTAYFINVARGGSVVTDDLVDALHEGQIAGAALDVTDPEPLPPTHPLWRTPNVIITPHVSSHSDLGDGAEIAVAKENLRRYVAGEPMLSVVDPERGY